MKPMQKCLKPAFYLMTSSGATPLFAKRSEIVIEVYEKMTLLLTCFITSLNWFHIGIVPIASFKSSSIQLDVHFVNDHPI